MSDGTTRIILWQVKDPSRAVAFDRPQSVGVHPRALAVEGDAALDALHEPLARLDDVEIEFAHGFSGAGPTRHRMVHIAAGGLRLEIIAVGALVPAAGEK